MEEKHLWVGKSRGNNNKTEGWSHHILPDGSGSNGTTKNHLRLQLFKWISIKLISSENINIKHA